MDREPTIQIPHGDLKNGDLCWREGHLFEVRDLSFNAERKGAEITGRVIVRFTGICVDPTDDIYNTSYNGGRYGAHADYPATIVVRKA
jgi:hypothetical protein